MAANTQERSVKVEELVEGMIVSKTFEGEMKITKVKNMEDGQHVVAYENGTWDLIDNGTRIRIKA